MPSGAKKRKAAKKKKEKEANINSSTNISRETTPGDEDARSQDGKCNGSGEVNASSLNDHHNCHNSLNGTNGKLEKNDASSVESILAEDQSLGTKGILSDKETNNERFERNFVVEVQNEVILSEHYDSKSISIGYIESGKKCYEGGDKNLNSSSSSGDKSSVTNEKTEACTSIYRSDSFDEKPDNSVTAAAIRINNFTSVGENTNSLDETALVANSIKSEVSMSKETICLTRTAAVENTVGSDVVASGLKEGADTLLSNRDVGTRVPVSYPDRVSKENEHKVLALSGENDQVGVKEQGSKYLEGKMHLSSGTPVIDASKGDSIDKDSEVPRGSKNQISAPAPLVARRTSFFSCCGLFDLMKGSNR